MFALLGPNGAGKTTTVEILEEHRRRTSGHVDVLGYDPQTGGRDLRERIGIVLQEAGFGEDFTVAEHASRFGYLEADRAGNVGAGKLIETVLEVLVVEDPQTTAPTRPTSARPAADAEPSG